MRNWLLIQVAGWAWTYVPDRHAQLTADILEGLCWRGEESLALAAGAVLLGGQMPKAA